MAEADLFCAVINQALHDATSPTWGVDKPERSLDRNAARRWLLDGSRDFHTVCEAAGVSASSVTRKANELAASGWKMPKRKLA